MDGFYYKKDVNIQFLFVPPPRMFGLRPPKGFLHYNIQVAERGDP